MENEAVPQDLCPNPDDLIRLLELAQRYGRDADFTLAAKTVAERHRIKTGHRLSWGCCAGHDRADFDGLAVDVA